MCVRVYVYVCICMYVCMYVFIMIWLTLFISLYFQSDVFVWNKNILFIFTFIESS